MRNSRAIFSTLAVLLTCGGCWEEIHYVPKPASVQTTVETAEQPAEVETVPVEPAAAEPQMEVAEAPPSPGADELFSPEGPAEAAVEDLAESNDASAETPPVDGSILPTPEGLAANLEQAGPGERSTEVGGRRGDLAATEEERRLVWEAASKWSLAAAYYAKGRDALRQSNLNSARAAAATLDIELPQLPTTTAADNLQATVIEGLRGESAVALTNALANRFGAAEAAVADLAIRSHLLLLTYSPRSGDAALQAEALRRAAEASGLPAEAWTPLVTLIDERAPFVEVRRAVFELDDRVESFLASALGGAP